MVRVWYEGWVLYYLKCNYFCLYFDFLYFLYYGMKWSIWVVGGFNGKFFENECSFFLIDWNNFLGCKDCYGVFGMENCVILDSWISVLF